MHPALAIVLAYVVGSVPSAYIAGTLRGVDLRKHGSGNLGATNVIRVLGPRIGLVRFRLLDASGEHWSAASRRGESIRKGRRANALHDGNGGHRPRRGAGGTRCRALRVTRCAVVGAGAWGTALADLLAGSGHQVRLW